MKSTPIETLLISLLLFAITALSFFIVFLIVPFSTCVFREYHVLADALFFIILYILLSALTVRILIKVSPLEMEEYGIANLEMTSSKAFYWKTLTSITVVGGMYFLPFVPLFLRPHFFALFGAKIGKNAEIAGTLTELPLVTIGEYAFIGGDTFITAHAVVHNLIILKPVKISERAVIGVGAIIMPGVEVGEGSIVAPGSVVPMDTIIPPYEYWSGMPAKKERSMKVLRSIASK